MMIQKCAPNNIAYTSAPATSGPKLVRRFSNVSKSPQSVYMKSPEFWNDPHNSKMAELVDKMMTIRDRVRSDTEDLNKYSVYPVKQGKDGYTKIAANVRRDSSLEYSHKPSIDTTANTELYDAEQQVVEEAKSELGKNGLGEKILADRMTPEHKARIRLDRERAARGSPCGFASLRNCCICASRCRASSPAQAPS